MYKRIVLLSAAALIVVLSAAPDAMASHCFRCKLAQQQFSCVPALGITPGYPICEADEHSCVTSGTQCATHSASIAPLASEFTVASVERLDDGGSDADETRVAPTRVAQSLTR